MEAIPEVYGELAQKVFSGFSQTDQPVTYSSDVAQAVWKAVNDPSVPMRLPAGADAVEWAQTA